MSIVEQAVPPLLNGDNLTRDEFLRRWDAAPHIKFAELIGGIVYMPPPVALDHGDSDNDVAVWLGHYAAATPGTRASSNATMLMLDDAPQADIHLRILPEAGGQSSIEGLYLRGAPELAAEICRTSAVYDLHQKLTLYQEAGVQEYVAVLLFEQEIRWRRLEQGAYQLLAPEDGIYRSRIFPGLWLDGSALLAGNMARVLTTLQQGLATADHADFAALLAKRMAR
jgi:Uma2 family endonuclease